MFGKMKQPISPFSLQVLTAEFLIEGTFAGSTSLYFEGQDSVVPVNLTSAQIQATGTLDVPTRTFSQFTVLGNNALAIIPQTDITQMGEYDFWKLYTKPIEGTFYIGPYVMQGKLMLEGSGRFRSQMPIYDVRIASQDSGARWSGLHAQVALVNFHWLRGYEPQ